LEFEVQFVRNFLPTAAQEMTKVEDLFAVSFASSSQRKCNQREPTGLDKSTQSSLDLDKLMQSQSYAAKRQFERDSQFPSTTQRHVRALFGCFPNDTTTE
jgi:hypothetical protein